MQEQYRDSLKGVLYLDFIFQIDESKLWIYGIHPAQSQDKPIMK